MILQFLHQAFDTSTNSIGISSTKKIQHIHTFVNTINHNIYRTKVRKGPYKIKDNAFTADAASGSIAMCCIFIMISEGNT
jgi:hypothetical protein